MGHIPTYSGAYPPKAKSDARIPLKNKYYEQNTVKTDYIAERIQLVVRCTRYSLSAICK